MSNEITAYFKGRTGVAESVYQYDYGMVLVFDGIELPATFDCYFSNEGDEEATPAIGADNRVAIPNKCLSVPGNVTVHIPHQTGLNDSEVEYVVTVKVINRAKPVDDGTEADQTAISKAIAALNHNNLPGLIPDIVNEWLDEHPEATTTVQDKSITLPKFSDEVITNPSKHFAINGERAVTKLGDVAMSYIQNRDDFVYGGRYTAIRDEVVQVDGKWQINCSTFAMLVSYGVYYQNSAYMLGAGNNLLDDACCSDLELWDWFRSENEGASGDHKYKYTYDLAEWLYNHGYCFEPNDDLSNIKPGDMLLMKGQTGGDGGTSTFRGIDHSCVFGYWNNDNMYTVWEVGNLPSAQQYFRSNLEENCVLVARFPMAESQANLENIALYNGIASTNQSIVSYIYARDGYKPGRYYTFIGKITNDADIANVYPAIFQGDTRLSGYNNALLKPMGDVYIIPFVPVNNNAINLRMLAGTSGITLPTTTLEWYNVVEGLHFSPEKLPFSRRATIALNSGFSSITNYLADNFLYLGVQGTFATETNSVGTVSGIIQHGTITPAFCVCYTSSGVVSGVEAYLYNNSLMVRNNTGASITGDMYIAIPIYNN